MICLLAQMVIELLKNRKVFIAECNLKWCRQFATYNAVKGKRTNEKDSNYNNCHNDYVEFIRVYL